jgi:hypothetical protein
MDNDVEGGSLVLSQDLTGRTDENHEKCEPGEPVCMLGIKLRSHQTYLVRASYYMCHEFVLLCILCIMSLI